jgi:ankyrin repeat protein
MWSITAMSLLLALASHASGQVEKPTTLDKLTSAIQEGDSGAIRALLANGVDLNTRDSSGTTALIESIEVNQPELAKELVVAGADPNFPDYTGSTALMDAAWNCRLEVAQYLLQHGARLDARDRVEKRH